jgi:fumarate reductase subunit D
MHADGKSEHLNFDLILLVSLAMYTVIARTVHSVDGTTLIHTVIACTCYYFAVCTVPDMHSR